MQDASSHPMAAQRRSGEVDARPAVAPGVERVQALEAQIRELEAGHSQLLAYAEDLNHTYQESRVRLQQMAELSGLAARLVRARNVENCARMSVDGLGMV